MEFLAAPQPPAGPPALEEPPETPDAPWDPVRGGPSSPGRAGPAGPAVLDLARRLEALPGDLGELPVGGAPCPLHVATGHGHGLRSAEADTDDLLSPLRGPAEPPLHLLQRPADPAGEPAPPEWAEDAEQGGSRSSGSSPEPWLETAPLVRPEEPPAPSCGPPPPGPEPDTQRPVSQSPESLASFPALPEVPGPCDHEDLLDGVLFGAKYLGSTQLLSERNPPPSMRMAQAQEAVDRVKAPDGETQPMTEVDLFVSTKRIKVLTAESQEALMDHALQTISYIADIGHLLVLMARRRLARSAGRRDRERPVYKMVCHVFHSEDAQLIAQAIGQAFAVAYSQFLREHGIDPSQVGTGPSAGASSPGHLHNGDLDHFSNSDNCREVRIEKRRGEGLGLALVESGWGSLLPTAVIANLRHGGPAERCGALSIGDRLTALNGSSLVGLPLAACQAAVREARAQTSVTLSIVHCPPVTTAIVRRPHAREQLGFCVEDGVICSLLRGGIAERGGVRVGHRIIEINGQSVVATPHARVIELLTEARDEVHIKTMPAATYRLLTGQEQPVFL